MKCAQQQLLTLADWFIGTIAGVAAERPNLLVIYTDDQSWRTLGCYREEGVHTPHIDYGRC